MSVDVSSGAAALTELSPSVSKPVAVVDVPPAPIGPFDVTPDNTFLMIDGFAGGGGTSELKIVLNWFKELREKAPLP